MRELHIIRTDELIKDHYELFINENGASVNGPFLDDIILESTCHTNKNYTKIYYIGSFSVDDDDFVDEVKVFDQIKVKKKVINYGIYVYNKEGPVPHFHIISNDGGREFDGCICIYEAKFFDHGVHTDILNSKGLKMLDTFLRTPLGEETYWNVLSVIWQYNNQEMIKKYPNNIKSSAQPDYTKTKGFVRNPDVY